jgi:hypothetical protein
MNEVVRLVTDHFVVNVLAAIILLLILFFWKRLLNLSSWFVPIKVHGKWSTTLTEPTAGTPSGGVKTQENQSQKTHEYVKLHQFFNKVWGDAFVQNEPRDVYHVRGQLVADKLALIFRDKKGFDTGAILLRVTAKDLMQGYEVGVDPAGTFYSGVYSWIKEVDRFPGRSAAH